MKRYMLIEELAQIIDVSMDVMKDNWDAEDIDLDAVIGNAQVVLDTARALKYYRDGYNDIKRTEDKRLFKFEYDMEMYSGEPIKYISIDELTAENGFIMDEVNELKNLKLKESIVIDNGFVKVTRIK